MASKPTLNDLMYQYYYNQLNTPVVAPGPPTSVVATPGNGQVSVAFTAPSSSGSSPITSYLVTLSTGQTQTGSASPIVVTGLTNGVAVTATVQAYNGVYGTASSASNSVTPSAGATAPGAPTGVTAVAGDAQAVVSFTAPASNGGATITGYRVTASTGQTQTGTASPITITGLTNGTAVTFTVQAQNSVGYGSPSSASNSVTPTASVGYDIILAAGQSNMNGRAQPIDPLIDVIDPNVFQFGSLASDSATYRQITPASDPMKMPDTANANRVGPSTSFGRAYAAGTGRKVLIVPVAIGGTAIVGGRWSSTAPGDLYTLAITQTNLAIAAAKAQYPDSKFVGTIWFQGETDGDNSVTQANYVSALNGVIAGFRSGITDATNSWFVMSQMVPEAIATKAGYPAIDLAHKQIATETPRTAIALTNDLTGYSSDNLHFTNSVGIRQVGARLYSQVAVAEGFPGVVPTNTALPVITGTPEEGQTLTLSNGTWTSSPTTFARQWRRNGTNIAGATGSSYLLVAADVGTVITGSVLASNIAGPATSPAISLPTSEIAPAGGSNPGIVYDFESDTVGSSPANTTPSDGYTFVVSTGGSSGLTGNYARMNDTPAVGTAAAGLTFNNFDSRAKQTVTWTHGQGTTGTTIRAGMVLRAGALPSGGTYPLMATGYLFMFRGTEMRIYRHTSDGTLTQLAASTTFAASLNRKFRASIDNTSLLFEHSTDNGTTWTVGASATDSSISAAGGVQFVSGFGGSQGGAYFDNVVYADTESPP